MKRIYIDMDGTLAVFNNQIESEEVLFQEGYYRNLEPQINVIEAARHLLEQENVEVFVLSAVLPSDYAEKEKNEWLDQYLPEVDQEHRLFVPCGEDKGKYIGHELGEDDLLLDDYSKNLHSWCPPGRAVKLMNEINGNFGTWQGKKISMHDTPEEISSFLLDALWERTAKDTFSIYQLKPSNETADLLSKSYGDLQMAGLTVDPANYDLMYTAPLAPDMELSDIFIRFFAHPPVDFTGRSLWISDVIVLHQAGQDTAYYVNDGEYFPVPEFLQKLQELTPDARMTGEQIRTPRGSFYVTDMTREQMEAAGYGFHHQSEDGKYFIMGNGKDAFAVASQREAKNRQPIKEQLDEVRRSRNETGPEKQNLKNRER